MPRHRRPAGPASAGGYQPLPQDQSVIPGGAYGSRKAQEESLAQQPLPDVRSTHADPLVAAEQGALRMPPPGPGLLAPPEEEMPLTAGLPRGPGPGPEALGFQGGGRIARVLRLVADATGDEVVANYATEAEARRL